MKKQTIIKYLFLIFALLFITACSNHKNNLEEYTDDLRYNLTLKAIDENNIQINSFNSKLENGTTSDTINGFLQLELFKQKNNICVYSPNRIPRYIQVVTTRNNEQRIVCLPKITSIAEKYELIASKTNIIGGTGKAANCIIEFPANSINEDAIAYISTEKIYTVNDEIISLKPGKSKININGQDTETKNNVTLFVLLLNKNGEVINNLNKQVKICVKPESSNIQSYRYSTFNESKFIWEDLGDVIFNSNTKMYEAFVSHFSWYDFFEPYKKETISNIKIKVANFQPSTPSPARIYGDTDEDTLLRLFSEFFKDMQNGVIESEEERVARKAELEAQAVEIAEKINKNNNSKTKNEADYELQDLEKYQSNQYCVKNAHITFKVMREWHTFAREEIYTDENGEANIQLDPEAIYCSIKVAYQYDEKTGVIAVPKLIDLDENKNGIIYINLAEYPVVNLQNGDYTGTI